MGLIQHIGWPIGNDRIYAPEILKLDGKHVSDPTKAAQDITGWSLAWTMSSLDDPDTLLIDKRNGTGITITGTYDVDRAQNSQRPEILIEDGDTDALEDGVYQHALKRMDGGFEDTLLEGHVKLTRSCAPAS